MPDRIDKLGRIVIPKRIRISCDLPIGAELEFVPAPESGGVLVRKKEKHTCAFCHAGEQLTEIDDGIFLCRNCIRKHVFPKSCKKTAEAKSFGRFLCN